MFWLLQVLALALECGGQTVNADSPIADQWMAAAPPVPPLLVQGSRAEWEGHRAEIRSQLWQLLGELPPRPKQVSVQTIQREERPGYLLEKFRFDNAAGAEVPGYLLLPQGGGKHPAILYCHWHGGEYDIGKEELFRSAHTPAVPAEALTKQGFAVIAIDAYCFGERNGKGPGGPAEKGSAGEMSASKFNLWLGRTLWGMILRDDLIALDYLCSRAEIDTNRIGVTGISMGATRSWWLMALDDRMKAGVAVACLTRYQDLIATEGLKQHGIYYFVPGMLRHFDTEAVLACIAPRALLCMTGDQDGGSPVEGVRKLERAVRPVYNLFEAQDQFRNEIYPNVGHSYLPEMWEKMLAWMRKSLNP